jgi:pimeloyl-ACP methyl ester carboxylesterase
MVSTNGVSVFVAEGGTGEPVVLLHGYPQSGEAWRPVAQKLATHYRVIVVDLRGMGLSQIPEGGFDLSNVAEDIHQLVQSEGFKHVMVAGHDWGGAIGAVYALRYRNEVTKLAFLESAVAGAGFEKLWNFSERNDTFTFIPFLLMGQSDTEGDTTGELIRGHESAFLKHLWSGFVGDKIKTPFSGWDPYVAAMKRPGLSVSSASYYRSAYKSADEVKSLITNKLDIPVLAIAGQKGIGVHHLAFVQPFAANIKGNMILPGAGHFLPEERPEEVASALQKFFSQ